MRFVYGWHSRVDERSNRRLLRVRASAMRLRQLRCTIQERRVFRAWQPGLET